MILSIFKKIFNKKSQKITKLEFNLDDSIINTIFYHYDETTEDAHKIANIIYALNTGLLSKQIIDSIISLKTNNKQFITDILSRINYLSTLTLDNVVVTPLETFNKNAK
jgi:hypothetical protein